MGQRDAVRTVPRNAELERAGNRLRRSAALFVHSHSDASPHGRAICVQLGEVSGVVEEGHRPFRHAD